MIYAIVVLSLLVGYMAPHRRLRYFLRAKTVTAAGVAVDHWRPMPLGMTQLFFDASRRPKIGLTVCDGGEHWTMTVIDDGATEAQVEEVFPGWRVIAAEIFPP